MRIASAVLFVLLPVAAQAATSIADPPHKPVELLMMWKPAPVYTPADMSRAQPAPRRRPGYIIIDGYDPWRGVIPARRGFLPAR